MYLHLTYPGRHDLDIPDHIRTQAERRLNGQTGDRVSLARAIVECVPPPQRSSTRKICALPAFTGQEKAAYVFRDALERRKSRLQAWARVAARREREIPDWLALLPVEDA